MTFTWTAGIGDTDAYGILFYSSYYRISDYVVRQQLNITDPSCIPIVHIQFLHAVNLGEQVNIELFRIDHDQLLVTWCRDNRRYTSLVLHVPTISISLPLGNKILSIVPKRNRLCSYTLTTDVEQCKCLFTRYSQTDCYLNPGSTIVDVLYWFERARSELIGGPSVLADMLTKGIHINVRTVSNVQLDSTKLVQRNTICQSYAFVQMLAVGHFIVFHMIYNTENRPVASGTVEMITFRQDTKEFVAPF